MLYFPLLCNECNLHHTDVIDRYMPNSFVGIRIM